MAGLCGQGAAYRAQAAELFNPIFLPAIADKENNIREAAVAGLIKIDGPKALAQLTAKNIANDPSATIRTNLMDLAGKIGGPNDLAWLTKIKTNDDGEAAWRAAMEIFKRCDSALLAEWISRLDADADAKLLPDQKAVLLEMAEQKAVAENNVAIVGAVRKQLAKFYSEQQQFDKAAKYYGMLAETASGQERDNMLAELLEVRLKAKQFDAATQLVVNRLFEKDIDANDIFVEKINSCLAQSPTGNETTDFVKTLAGIGGVESKPKWRQQLAHWQKQFESNRPPTVAPAVEPNKTAAAPTAPVAKI
jgi:hypothetical protein